MYRRFTVSGARGVVGEGLEPRLALELSAALAELLDDGPVVVGRDSRTSGPVFRHAVLAALLGAGRRVIDIGVVTTPTTQLAVEWREAAGGIMITASHNPISWNGLKFIGPSGSFLTPERVEKMKTFLAEGAAPWVGHADIGVELRWDHAVEHHIDAVCDLVDTELIAAAGLEVAVDCCGGAGGVIIPDLLDRLGVAHRDLGCRADGRFTRDPEPLAANIGELADLVAKSDAVLGLAFDSDVDRLALVGATGTPLGEERTLQLAALSVLEGADKPAGLEIACNLSTSRCLEDIAAAHGARVLRAPVGEVNVVELIRARGCPVGGEGNGGVIYPKLHLGRDAVMAAALILEQLARTGKTPEQNLTPYPDYEIVKVKQPVPDPATLERAYEHLRGHFPDAERDERDGLRLAWKDRWLHLRPSGTEPVVRIFAETPDRAAAQQLVEIGRALLNGDE
jgi:phosphomannomutase